MEKKVVLTYGTFDLFHVGHLNILKRLKALGSHLVVGVSTDEFNEEKGKKTIIKFEDRVEIVGAIKCVDLVIPEQGWDQKISDIKKYNASIFGMGHDWKGRFDDLGKYCQVVYLPRTDGVSSTELKRSLEMLNEVHIKELKLALDLMSSIVDRLS